MPSTCDMAAYMHQSSPAGAHLPRYKASNINRILKKVPRLIETPKSERYASRDFRMGSAQEIKETGPQLPDVEGAGGCRSLAFNCYVDLDLRDENTRDIANIYRPLRL